MTSDDDDGLARTTEQRALLFERTDGLIERHRPWLHEQLEPLLEASAAAQRDLRALGARRAQEQRRLAAINPNPHRKPSTPLTWVLSILGLTLLAQFVSAPRGTQADVILLAGVDAALLLAGFLALTPHWSAAPRPPAAMPRPPRLHQTAPLWLGDDAPWRERLEEAQGALARWHEPEVPSESSLLERVLQHDRRALGAFLAQAQATLANPEGDHYGWEALAWDWSFPGLRPLCWLALGAGVLMFTTRFGEQGFIHGSLGCLGALAAGFARGASLSFVDPPERD